MGMELQTIESDIMNNNNIISTSRTKLLAQLDEFAEGLLRVTTRLFLGVTGPLPSSPIHSLITNINTLSTSLKSTIDNIKIGNHKCMLFKSNPKDFNDDNDKINYNEMINIGKNEKLRCNNGIKKLISNYGREIQCYGLHTNR